MFSLLFSLLLLLLMVGFGSEIERHPFPHSLLLGLCPYLATLALIVGQNWCVGRHLRGRGKERLLLLAQGELLLSLFYSLLHAKRLYQTAGETVVTAIALALYFLGLYLFYATISTGSRRNALLPIRFLIPFCLPFLFYTLLVDWFSFSNSLLLLSSPLLLLFPTLAVRLWGCRPMAAGPLRDRLEGVCERLHYRCAGILTWPPLRRAHTAGMIGLLPRSRYILFTEGLLRTLQPEEVEAVLAHEIGHSQRGHLLFYPILFLGLVVLLGLYAAHASQPVHQFILQAAARHPTDLWKIGEPLLLFVSYTLLLLLYIRLLFGYLSRNLEREADLHVYQAGLPTSAMIGALNRIAMTSGVSHHHPSWHHYSIADRIDFLHRCAVDPTLIARHHRKVKRMIWSYLGILILATLLLVLA